MLRKINLNIIFNELIMDSCYMLKADNYKKVYIGYTVNLGRRLRQHNKEIEGGAKKTSRWVPWSPICHITGFIDNHQALRFEYRLQQMTKKGKKGEDIVLFYVKKLCKLIGMFDKGLPWPTLNIQWFPSYAIYTITGNVINS